MKLCDYLPMLKELEDIKRIKKCKKEIISNYPKVIKELDSLISNGHYEHTKEEAFKLKKTIMEGYKRRDDSPEKAL